MHQNWYCVQIIIWNEKPVNNINIQKHVGMNELDASGLDYVGLRRKSKTSTR
jgi:hypothetical protein